jgi:hypothetical protein
MARYEVRSAGRGWALAGVCVVLTAVLGPPALSAQEIDLDSRVRVQFGGFRYDRAGRVFVTSGTLTDISSEVLLEPLSLVLTSVSPDVTLANSSGQTGDGLPFVSVPRPDGFLCPGGRVKDLILKFNNPSGYSQGTCGCSPDTLRDVSLAGPRGLALGRDGSLYVADSRGPALHQRGDGADPESPIQVPKRRAGAMRGQA